MLVTPGDARRGSAAVGEERELRTDLGDAGCVDVGGDES
jgi:hypothetical protein